MIDGTWDGLNCPRTWFDEHEIAPGLREHWPTLKTPGSIKNDYLIWNLSFQPFYYAKGGEAPVVHANKIPHKGYGCIFERFNRREPGTFRRGTSDYCDMRPDYHD
jgi:hypothetical protein